VKEIKMDERDRRKSPMHKHHPATFKWVRVVLAMKLTVGTVYEVVRIVLACRGQL
jgi:hypothetical protein